MAKKQEQPKTKKITARGRTFRGKVVSDKAQKTVTVEWDRRIYVPKYERYLLKRSKVKAHNPSELDAKEGDIVVIKECRPVSKTKKFVVVEVLDKK
ncbi:30S ribosomal protein S17 [Candidatus Woesearchaeota archaeon]|nr:30S ribosomal protein S17 [Candidatus Woesearchaeota archaeon]